MYTCVSNICMRVYLISVYLYTCVPEYLNICIPALKSHPGRGTFFHPKAVVFADEEYLGSRFYIDDRKLCQGL